MAMGYQNAGGGKYPVLGLSWHTFPLQAKPLLDQWLHNMTRNEMFPSKSPHLCRACSTEDCCVQDVYEKLIGDSTQDP